MEIIYDVATDEMTRQALVMEAAPDLDPTKILARQRDAYRLLYSNLDEGQQATYDMLREEGVL